MGVTLRRRQWRCRSDGTRAPAKYRGSFAYDTAPAIIFPKQTQEHISHTQWSVLCGTPHARSLPEAN